MTDRPRENESYDVYEGGDRAKERCDSNADFASDLQGILRIEQAVRVLQAVQVYSSRSSAGWTGVSCSLSRNLSRFRRRI